MNRPASLWLLALLGLPILSTEADQAPPRAQELGRLTPSDCVVLLHGLSRTSFSMQKIEEALESQGYVVSNVHYDSRDGRIEELAQSAVGTGIDECRQQTTGRLHFTTHSLGGILVRHYLSQHTIRDLGRVVMLAPPNHGSEIIDVFGRVPGFELISGEPAAQLGTTGPNSIPAQLPAVDFELGVIAGDRSISPIFSWTIPARDDGKVSVESTQVDGMRDFIVMPYTHTFIMQRQAVIDQVLHFLEHGRFRHDNSNQENTGAM